MKVCLFGGSFDPLHNGHVSMANHALEKKGVDKVIVIPAFRSPLKESAHQAEPEHRLEMARLAFQGNPRIQVSDFEIRRRSTSYTIDTIRHFRNALGPAARLFWLIGADSVATLPKWKDFHELIELCDFIVIPRKGFPRSIVRQVEFRDKNIARKISDAFLDVPPVDVSSTEVRNLLARGGNAEGLVPAKVLDYIREKGLYSLPRNK